MPVDIDIVDSPTKIDDLVLIADLVELLVVPSAMVSGANISWDGYSL